MKKDSKIYIAGHTGLVGGAILRHLQREGYTNLVLRTRGELDLLNTQEVNRLFFDERPEYVFMCGAKVGGIGANTKEPADFIYENIKIQTNLIKASYEYGVTKLLFLGSSCIYPRLSPQPIKEEYFLSGELEPTNRAYAVAKIAGITMCQSFNKQYGTNFVSVMPTNLYGPNDNYDLETAHVLPAMIRKFHEGNVALWGDGSARREFLYVDDLAEACVFLMNTYNESEIINIGTGEDVSIKDLANLVGEIVGHKGEVTWDTSKPNGMPRKLLDVSKINALGWKAKTPLVDGVRRTYEAYIS